MGIYVRCALDAIRPCVLCLFSLLFSSILLLFLLLLFVEDHRWVIDMHSVLRTACIFLLFSCRSFYHALSTIIDTSDASWFRRCCSTVQQHTRPSLPLLFCTSSLALLLLLFLFLSFLFRSLSIACTLRICSFSCLPAAALSLFVVPLTIEWIYHFYFYSYWKRREKNNWKELKITKTIRYCGCCCCCCLVLWTIFCCYCWIFQMQYNRHQPSRRPIRMSLEISKPFFPVEFLFGQKLKNLLIFKLVANIDEDDVVVANHT